MRAVVLCLLLSAVAISANLQSDLDEILSPMLQSIEPVARKYVATYPHVRAALEYLQTVDDEKIFNDIVNNKQANNVLKYLTSRGIDGEALMRHMITVSKDFHRKLLEQESTDEANSNSPAITGDFNRDVGAAINGSEILALVQEKEKSSTEFAHYVTVMTDPEFITLLRRGLNSRAIAIDNGNGRGRGFFKKVWQKIKDVGFGIGVTIPLGK